MDRLLSKGDINEHYQYFEDYWSKKRAEVNTKDENGLTPLQYASQNGHLEVVICLIENGADVHLWNTDFSEDGKHWATPLHLAAQGGYLEVVKFLLNFFHVDTWDKDRLTPLHWATRNGHYDVVKCLIENRARVDAKHFYTLMTPLHFASQNGHHDIVGYLLKNEVQKKAMMTDQIIPPTDSISTKSRQLRREVNIMNLKKQVL